MKTKYLCLIFVLLFLFFINSCSYKEIYRKENCLITEKKCYTYFFGCEDEIIEKFCQEKEGNYYKSELNDILLNKEKISICKIDPISKNIEFNIEKSIF
jgi:hypothetical protein